MTPPLVFDELLPAPEALLAAGAEPEFGPGGARRADVVTSRIEQELAAAFRNDEANRWNSPRPGYRATAAGRLQTEQEGKEDGCRALCLALHRRMADRTWNSSGWGSEISMLGQVSRHAIPWSSFDLRWALSKFPTKGRRGPGAGFRHALELPIVMLASIPPEELALFGPALAAIDGYLRESGPVTMPPADLRRLHWRLAEAIARFRSDGPAPRWPYGINHDQDAFAPAAQALLVDRDPANFALLDHCDELSEGRKPSARWRRKGAELLAATPGGAETVRELLRLFLGQREIVIEVGPGWVERRLLFDWSVTLLRGLVWLAAEDPGEATTVLLAEVAGAAGRPYAKGGPGVPRVGRLASAAISALETRVEVIGAELARLRALVRNKPLRARIDALIVAAAHRAGLTFDAYVELAVPTHGLDAERRLRRTLGDYEAEISIDSTHEVRLAFSRGGKALKTAPAALRRDNPDAVAELRAAVKAIRATLTSERRRVDELFSAERTWTPEAWRSQLMAHPLTSSLAGTLLWRFGEHTVLPRPDGDGGWILENLARLPVTPDAGQSVRLWHPGAAPAEEVAAWRDRMVTENLRQAVKQVFREVYPLTPAELATRSYSNRFAGHVLHYRQAAALLGTRGWEVAALGYWDDGYEGTASKTLGAGGWQALFRYALVDENSDIAQYCTTDQVRFSRRDGEAWRPVDLAQVPALVLSEALRDVDLAVGVASIAADPTWFDRGDNPFFPYWHGAVDAELTPSAEVRRDALARLLPRTTLAGHTELTDRYLRVNGTLSTYRIHLGSANVLVEPENSYLCIVPTPGQGPQVLLPFDDDRLLSLILSKAFLLLDDQDIDDRSILSQLPRRAAASAR